VNEEGKSEGLKTWDFVLGVNLTGTYNLIRLSLEHLVKVKPEDTEDEERGVIILTGSEASVSQLPIHN
jgi:3-hydroxyacyl-CoA dehydrogenase/3-hydroxy-2-methylbutyryl-CoA dehydrogenase